MTALQPPILNLTRLNISSGWPSDFRMSMLLQVFSCYSDKLMCEPGEMFPIKAMFSRDATAAEAAAAAARRDHRSQSQRVTPLICWRVMGLARSVQ